MLGLEVRVEVGCLAVWSAVKRPQRRLLLGKQLLVVWAPPLVVCWRVAAKALEGTFRPAAAAATAAEEKRQRRTPQAPPTPGITPRNKCFAWPWPAHDTNVLNIAQGMK